MRLCFHRGGQHPRRGRTMGEAAADRGDRRGSVGVTLCPNALPHHFAPIMSAASFVLPRSRRRAKRAGAAPLARRHSRRSKIAKWRAGSPNREPPARHRSPTADTGGPPGISTSSKSSAKSRTLAGERKIKFQPRGPQPRPRLLRILGKLGGYRPHPMIEHFKFLRAHTRSTPKVTIPSPSSLHFRYGRDAVPAAICPAMDDFYRDL